MYIIEVFRTLPLAVVLLNILFALVVVFVEKRNPGKTWAWLMVILVVPFFGVFLYWILGFDSRKYATFERKRILDESIDKEIKRLNIPGLSCSTATDKDLLQIDATYGLNDLARLNFVSSGAVLTKNNSLQMFHEGNEKFNSLLDDIENAECFIHMLYYVFRNDNFGTEVVAALAKCAARGVEVKIIVDGSGMVAPPKRLFRPLFDAGGMVAYFAPPSITRVNFRNHRKIAVIDGVIGYIGGLNIGDEYLGRSKRFGFWRDTHMRVEGDAVKSIEERFIMDWNYKADIRKNTYNKIAPSEKYLPLAQRPETGKVMQIVSGGPDTEWSSVYFGYSKMITEAKKKYIHPVAVFRARRKYFRIAENSRACGHRRAYHHTGQARPSVCLLGRAFAYGRNAEGGR